MYTSRNHLRAMGNDELRRYAPSVFATEAHTSRSDRYTYIPTTRVVAKLIEAQRDTARPRFTCTDCYCSTTEPSFTDSSDVVCDPDTGPRLSGLHYACCPRCGSTRLQRVLS